MRIFMDDFDYEYYIRKNSLKKMKKYEAFKHFQEIGLKNNMIYRYTTNNIIYYPLIFNAEYDFLPDKSYIIRNIDTRKDFNLLKEMFNEHDFNLFIVEGCDTKEIILSVKACEKINCMNLKTILSKSYNNGIIHTIESKAVQTFSFINELYYLLGESRIDYKYFGLNSFYKEYTAFNDNRQYNKFITLMCYSYYLGFHNKKIKDINKIMDRNMYHKEKVLILSKLIKNTGGVQKTSLQLMETLDYKFNVDIFSVQMKDQDFDLKTNYLNMNIPNKFILKIRREQEIIDHINNADYKYIIVNKLNEVFKFTDKINKKIQIIVHNPKDPLNEMIIKNQQYVEKCHVLTNYHKNLMKYLGFNKSLKTYNNYVFKESEMCKTHVKKSTFSNNICFVGRLSKEKNIPLLIKSFNVFNSIKKEMKLYIIGSGRKYKNDNQIGRASCRERV